MLTLPDNPTPAQIEAHRKALYDKAVADAKAQSDQWMKDDNLARAKGSTPEHIEARKRVAKLFMEMHFDDHSPAVTAPYLAAIDYTLPVTTTNGRIKNLENPKGSGLLGMGRKPAYIQSKRFPPKNDTDPIYVLEFYPVKN